MIKITQIFPKLYNHKGILYIILRSLQICSTSIRINNQEVMCRITGATWTSAFLADAVFTIRKMCWVCVAHMREKVFSKLFWKYTKILKRSKAYSTTTTTTITSPTRECTCGHLFRLQVQLIHDNYVWMLNIIKFERGHRTHTISRSAW